ncbi:MAG: hypothetical protein B1H40_05060 [Candidatus Latescibacteria bacterium 4484_181]|nr:MAG: hypothetical protein B1H40_05060 [Candidatus Latescibacteria bacterium 4484_181]
MPAEILAVMRGGVVVMSPVGFLYLWILKLSKVEGAIACGSGVIGSFPGKFYPQGQNPPVLNCGCGASRKQEEARAQQYPQVSRPGNYI